MTGRKKLERLKHPNYVARAIHCESVSFYTVGLYGTNKQFVNYPVDQNAVGNCTHLWISTICMFAWFPENWYCLPPHVGRRMCMGRACLLVAQFQTAMNMLNRSTPTSVHIGQRVTRNSPLIASPTLTAHLQSSSNDWKITGRPRDI